MKLLLLNLFVLILLLSCSGNEIVDIDTTPPLKPRLIPHLGDAGDGQAQNIDGELIEINDENNGIDAVPYGNSIKISWDFLEDTDLDHIKINRFSLYNPQPVAIDSILADGGISYTDISLQDGNAFGQEWQYFIEVFDMAGNSSVSDTTGYELVHKPILQYPNENQLVNAAQLYWRWDEVSGIDHYRVLLFDNNGTLFWHDDVYQSTTSGDSLAFTGEIVGSFFSGEWRVDAISDNITSKGSESKQRSIRINQY